MKIPKRWLPYVEGCAAPPPEPRVQERALALCVDDAASRKRGLSKSLARRQGEAALEDLRQAAHAELVRRARVRDGHLCQLCPEDVPRDKRCAQPGDPLEPHHLDYGGGKSQRERLETLITGHESCHRACQMNEAAYVERVKAWCDRNGYRYPNRRAYR